MHFITTMGLAMALLPLTLTSVSAGVIIGGTRIIFDGTKKEASIGITNPDNVPYLIQSWIDVQDEQSGKAPFIITPPLYRLDGGQKNLERIVMTGSLPQGQESLFWLNIKAIPSASKQMNSLQIAVKTDFCIGDRYRTVFQNNIELRRSRSRPGCREFRFIIIA